MTTRSVRYVIQLRKAQGDAPNQPPWVDYRPIEDEAGERQRFALLQAHRRQTDANGTGAEWRLLKRITIEEDVEGND